LLLSFFVFIICLEIILAFSKIIFATLLTLFHLIPRIFGEILSVCIIMKLTFFIFTAASNFNIITDGPLFR